MKPSIHPTLALALASFAPPQSEVHQIVREDLDRRIDAAMLADKERDAYAQRKFANALRLQQALPESLRGVL